MMMRNDGIASSVAQPIGTRTASTTMTVTMSVGANRRKAVRTADIGSSARGNAWFMTSFEPLMTDAAPPVMQFATK